MLLWLLILTGAFSGGLLVLHGFSKTKEVDELVLQTYEDLLKQVVEEKIKQQKKEMDERENEREIEVALAADTDELPPLPVTGHDTAD